MVRGDRLRRRGSLEHELRCKGEKVAVDQVRPRRILERRNKANMHCITPGSASDIGIGGVDRIERYLPMADQLG